MARGLRYLVSYGSLLLALVMFGYGAFLIQKNTPKKKVVPVRFNPPMNPEIVSPVADQGSSSAEPAVSDSNHGPDSHHGKGKRFVGGVGIIEPAGEAISIGSQLPGVVSKIFVMPGDEVHQGDPILQLDDRSARANVEVSRSNLAAQEAKLAELMGQIAPQKARVDAALAFRKQMESTLKNVKQELLRVDSLATRNAISAEEIGQRQVNVEIAEGKKAESDAKYREALSSLSLLEGPNAPTIEVQRVAVEQARALLNRDEVQWKLHTLVAPSNSTVLQVKVRTGEFLPASVLANPLITLGVIDPFHVRVDVDEADIPRFQAGAKAFASVRGRPELSVPLTFVRTEPYVIPKRSLNGNVSERVDTRVLQVIYSVAPDQIKAVAGQQVDVYIEETD